jgi:hypothetical protein
LNNEYTLKNEGQEYKTGPFRDGCCGKVNGSGKRRVNMVDLLYILI